MAQVQTNLHVVKDARFGSDTDQKYLTLCVGEQRFAIPISQVLQIVSMQEITPIPMFPHYAKGIINLRGAPTPVIDLRLRLCMPELEYNERTCIVVLLLDKQMIGIIVDAVDEVTVLPDSAISNAPALSNNAASAYVSGVAHCGDDTVLLIKIETLIDASQFEGIM